MSVSELVVPATGEGELRSVSIAVGVLECFTTTEELGPTQVARRLGIAKSTASRMLSALTGGGMLERTPAGRYRLSLRLFQFGQLAIDRLPLRAVARPVLLDLQQSLRETVQLGVPAAGSVLFVERLGAAGVGAVLTGEVLRRVPGYSSSAGRAMAAFDPQIAQDILATARHRQTPFTVVDGGRLTLMLRQVRQAGWAASHQECVLGYSSLAAPVLTAGARAPARVVGAVSVVGPSGHLLGPRRDFIVASVCRAARRIGAALSALEED